MKVMELGFPLQGRKEGKGGWEDIRYCSLEGIAEVRSHTSRSFLTTSSEGKESRALDGNYTAESATSGYGSEEQEPDSFDSWEVDPDVVCAIRNEYDQLRITPSDPFQVIRASWFAEQLGKPRPQVLQWSADSLRLSDRIPQKLLAEGGYTGKGSLEFTRIEDPDLVEFVIFKHTHWGAALEKYASGRGGSELVTFARCLTKRVKAFVRCSRDPTIKSRHYSDLFTGEFQGRRSQRLERLLECLKTVDGMFQQRFLAFPEERWTWTKYDVFILGNLSVLITDEFFDGTPTAKAMEIRTAYSQLKAMRKSLKYEGHLNKSDFLLELKDQPWLQQFSPLCRRLAAAGGERRTYILGLLSQTRGSGTPPPLCVLQAKRDFLLTVSKEPIPLSNGVKSLLRLVTKDLMSGIPDEALTGLRTAARLRITTAACFEHAVADGGTAQAVNDLVKESLAGRKVIIRDLYTGAIRSYATRDDLEVGEYIFWRCLEEVLVIPPDKLTEVSLLMVREPGKSRTVSKGRACLKIVLDVVNKLVSKPFAKAFPTSASGMERSNHGWNFFKSMFHGIGKEIVFSQHAVQTEVLNEREKYKTHVWETVFASSTDFNTATDMMHHEVASLLGGAILDKTGVPPFLKGIVNRCCFQDRWVIFRSSGELDHIGEGYGEGTRRVLLRTGILMGDPLTKIVLHLVNLAVRRLAVLLMTGSIANAPNAATIDRLIGILSFHDL